MSKRQAHRQGFIAIVVVLWLLGHGGAVLAAGMGIDDARHLLSRTGFGPTWAEIRRYAALSRTEGVERLLDESGTTAVTPPPDWVGVYPPPVAMRTLSEEARQRINQERREQSLQLVAWWFAEMRATPSPLTERMTLFWHGHFTSALNKVSLPILMYRQNVLLRYHALGRFDALLHEIAKDPAMLRYLDGAVNRKARPNENFAREVMELFTLGEGHYTEADVKAAARSFTGWSIDWQNGSLCFRSLWHDSGVKTLLGHRGTFDGDQVLDLLLQRPETARHVVRKFWREFVSPQPDAAEVERLARAFRQNHYEIKPLLRMLLESPAFWTPANRGALIKSPVEFLLGMERQLSINPLSDNTVLALSSQLGQNLLNPPNVKGWPGGEDWLDGRTVLLRRVVARQWSAARRPRPATTRTKQPGQKPVPLDEQPLDFEIQPWVKQFGANADWHAQAERLLLPLPPLRRPATTLPPIQYVQGLLLDPVFQLK
ncbi:MAG: DUF1800 domain-containing protein [Thiohalocapsa sp.]|uniref:DUF1800 domain-containing protein n=1 Tax=Thiohalocapsa sp. TaxID=2497641 RepID=UPI0025DDD0D0|nr:DUF1800 domain-containing protein [Thiohalocapsa sp.]MCG6940693.1 DUF1800 domain-containing protein [Thiohalocapsa sp.]